MQTTIPAVLGAVAKVLNAGDESAAQEVLENLVEVAEAHPRFLRKQLAHVVTATLQVGLAGLYIDGIVDAQGCLARLLVVSDFRSWQMWSLPPCRWALQAWISMLLWRHKGVWHARLLCQPSGCCHCHPAGGPYRLRNWRKQCKEQQAIQWQSWRFDQLAWSQSGLPGGLLPSHEGGKTSHQVAQLAHRSCTDTWA